MNLKARREAKKLAEQAFSIARDRILAEYGNPEKSALEKTQETKNSGSHAPALIEWATNRVRGSILAFADSYTQAFNEYDLPSDSASEAELKAFAQQVTAGSIAAVVGHQQLHSKRTRKRTAPLPIREIEQAQRLAVREATLVLRRQRTSHLKANTLGVLGEEGLITGTEALEQWHRAFSDYRTRFEGLGHFGNTVERWFRLQHLHYERWFRSHRHARALEDF